MHADRHFPDQLWTTSVVALRCVLYTTNVTELRGPAYWYRKSCLLKNSDTKCGTIVILQKEQGPFLGIGLHSSAFTNLGAREVVAFDIVFGMVLVGISNVILFELK